MQKQADIVFQNNIFFLQGDLDFANVMSVYEKSLTQIKQSQNLIFNFSKVKSSDSSALALIIEWIKLSRLENKSICFTNLSDQLISIAQAAGIDSLLQEEKIPAVVNT